MKIEREAWREDFAADPHRLILPDESSTNTVLDRTHGRAARGVPGDGPVPHGQREATTPTAAVRLDGLLAPAFIACDRPTDAEFLGDPVQEVLVPTPRAGDLVIMDNLSGHESAGVALNAVEMSDIRDWFGHAGHRTALSSDTAGREPISRWTGATSRGSLTMEPV